MKKQSRKNLFDGPVNLLLRKPPQPSPVISETFLMCLFRLLLNLTLLLKETVRPSRKRRPGKRADNPSNSLLSNRFGKYDVAKNRPKYRRILGLGMLATFLIYVVIRSFLAVALFDE